MTDTIKEIVANKISNSSSEVQERVSNYLAEEEIKSRAEILVKAVNHVDGLIDEGKKLSKPDQVSVDSDGNVLSESFSQKRYEELKKNRDTVDKWKSAIDAAWTRGEYKSIRDLAKNAKLG